MEMLEEAERVARATPGPDTVPVKLLIAALNACEFLLGVTPLGISLRTAIFFVRVDAGHYSAGHRKR
jgi:hypothetical protein